MHYAWNGNWTLLNWLSSNRIYTSIRGRIFDSDWYASESEIDFKPNNDIIITINPFDKMLIFNSYDAGLFYHNVL